MIRHTAHKHDRRAHAIAAAETWAAHNHATRDLYLPLPWPLRFWLWRRRQYAKVGRRARAWYGVWHERRHGPRREREVWHFGGRTLCMHPATFEALRPALGAQEVAAGLGDRDRVPLAAGLGTNLYGVEVVTSSYVAEWREVPTLDAAGHPKWSPRFEGIRQGNTLAQTYNTVVGLDPAAMQRPVRP